MTKQIWKRFAAASLFGILLIGLGSAKAQITPLQDAYTNSADAKTNYGANVLLDVDGATQISYIQFNLSSIPSGSSISQATLKLYVNAVTTAGTFNVDYVKGAWAESTLTYDTAPTLGAAIASDVSITTADKNQYVLINVTQAVSAWLDGSEANDGLALVANSTFNASFDSKENTTTSHPAELDIVFAGGGTITGVTTASGSGLTGGGTSGSLDLSLTTSCSSNQVLQWNGTKWACAAAGTGTITGVTAGTGLTGGGTSGGVTLNVNTSTVPLLNAANTFVGNQTITGNLTETGNITATGAITGQTGTFTANSSSPVTTITQSGSGVGLLVNAAHAVYGIQSTATLLGLYATATAAGGDGLSGNSTSGVGVYGYDNAASGTSVGVTGQSTSSAGYGVVGQGATGVVGTSTVCCGLGGAFTGYNAPSGSGFNGATGVTATGGNPDPEGEGNGGDGLDAYGGNVSSSAYGGNGGNGTVAYGGAGVTFDGVGGVFTGGHLGEGGDGVDGYAGTGFAGNFYGDVNVSGTLSAATKHFKIDHPLDPANKYLVHASVESSEMMNIYTGNVSTDAQGEATVQLPDWFEALNTDFRYQLTVIGQFAQAIIFHKIENHQFQIRTSAPNVEVSWQITGVRQDAYAKAHPLVVEEEKDARLKGYYIHPDLFGAPEEKQIEFARHPQMMKKVQEMRTKQLAAAQKQIAPRN